MFVSCIRTGRNAAAYCPGLVSLPPSDHHGPLTAFETVDQAVDFVGNLLHKDGKDCVYFWCKYILSRARGVWYHLGGDLDCAIHEARLPPGTVLCDAIVLMERINMT